MAETTNNTERTYTQAEVDEMLKAAQQQNATQDSEPSKKEKRDKVLATGGKILLAGGLAVGGFFLIKDVIIPFFNKDKNPEAIDANGTYTDEYGNPVEVTQF